MPLDCFKYIYNLKACDFWPTLTRRQNIPVRLKSRQADASRPSKLGLGFAEAAGFFLTGQVRLGRDGDCLSIIYESNRGGRRLVSANQQAGGQQAGSRQAGDRRIWHDANSMKAPAFLALAEAVLLEADAFEESRTRWEALLGALAGELGGRPPYPTSDLQAASTSAACCEAMMALSDALYFEIKSAFETGGYAFGQGPMAYDDANLDELFGSAGSKAGAPGPSAAPLERTLSVLIGTGGTALLIGPTGTFKTTTATRAALGAGAALTVVKGRPGLDDRDFFGGVTPTESGPAWVDGPVTRAFRQAQEGPAVLLVDELLRFEPLYLGALVGLLDPALPAELESRGITPATGGEHYVAELPTGERVAAPAANLTLVATTNMGADYVQATGLDAALMGRFELVVEVEQADPAVCERLYREAAGEAGFADGAKLLHALEGFTREHHIDDGGLFVRRAHPRLMLSMARHMGRLQQAGTSRQEAAMQAACVTLVPYCVERGPDGLLDRSGRRLLLDEVERLTGP